MSEETSLVLKMIDEVTYPLKSISNVSKGLTKEFDVLKQKTDQLSKRYVEFNRQSVDLSSKALALKKQISETEKVFKKTGDTSSRVKLDGLRNEYNELTDAAKGYRTAAADTIKEMNQVAEAARKLKDRDSSGFIGKNFGSGLAAGLAGSGILKDLGNTASEIGSTMLESRIGQPMADALSQALSGTISGAAAGMIAGAPGALIGAGLGAVVGIGNAANDYFQKEDDAFKSYVQEQYETAMSDRETTLTSGSTTAGSREQTQMAFAQRFGSEEDAKAYLDQVKAMSTDTNYTYDEITAYSKKLLNSYDKDKTLDVLMSLSDATAGLGLSSSDVDVWISGLSRMRTTGKATQEYLNYFSERGLDVYQAIAEGRSSAGKKTEKSQVAELVTKGSIGGTDAAAYILDYINEQFGGLSEKLSTTYDAMKDNLADAQANLDAAMGEGYNEERKKGIDAQQDWLSGFSGERQEEANRAIGAWQASLENEKERLIRDSVDSAMNSNEYRNAQATGDAAKMGEIIARARIQGENQYNASEGAQLQLQSEMSLIQGIRDDASLNEAYYLTGFKLGNQFTKGLFASKGKVEEFVSPEEITYKSSLLDDMNAWAASENAFGLNYVPYDNYPALLHQGERVQTAEEARRASGGVTVKVSGNNFSVRNDSDIQAIAVCLADEIESRALVHGG